MSIENVKAFYTRLASDEAFRTQLQAVISKQECSQIVKNAGYNFTTDEFEEYTIKLLELTSDNDEIKDVDEKELEAVFGGASKIMNVNADFNADVNLNLDISINLVDLKIDPEKLFSTVGILIVEAQPTIQASYGTVVGEDLRIELVTNGDFVSEFFVNDISAIG